MNIYFQTTTPNMYVVLRLSAYRYTFLDILLSAIMVQNNINFSDKLLFEIKNARYKK